MQSFSYSVVSILNIWCGFDCGAWWSC